MIDYSKLNWTIVAAGAASIGVFWSQLKAIFSQITSVIFVTFETTNSEHNVGILRYCWDHFKPGIFGNKSYRLYHDFIKPKQSYGWVAVKAASSDMIFWDGWKPLFLSYNYSQGVGASTKFTFIRGMFDADDLMIKSTEYFNDMNGINSRNQRFFVRKFHGESPSMSKESAGSVEATDELSKGGSSYKLSGYKVIGYTDEDIGIPTNESPFESLCYSNDISEFTKYLKRWKKSKDWYLERHIPWKAGTLLYGKPGTGKTSFVRAVAQELDMPIAMMDLTSMSNDELNKAWKQSMDMAPVVILFEDLDRIFDKDKNVISGNFLKASLTLDSLLNCMSGIDPSDGVLVMVTANDVSKIDPSIGSFGESGVSSRPGRLDIALEFKELNEECRRGVADRILIGLDAEFVNRVIAEGDGETGAQFTKRCSDIALKMYWDSLGIGKSTGA